MKIPVGLTRGLLGLAFLGLMVLAVLGFQAQQKDAEGLRESKQESIYWSTSQAEAELARFLSTLGRYSLGDPEIDAKEVNLRFNIVWSRVLVFREGPVGRRISGFDVEDRVIDELWELLQAHDAEIGNINRGDTALHSRIIAEFSEAGERLHHLSVKVLKAEEERFAGVRDNLRTSGQLTWVVSTSALVLAMLVIGVMLIETNRYRRMAEESAELARRAEAASSAKSRFLTMMSHELRTPMNGVLGLMALTRQTQLTDRQQRLLDQAARSARQMGALLGDILDFSDLQSDKLVLAQDTFAPITLVRAVDEMTGTMVQRKGAKLILAIDDGVPARVTADFRRLRQVLGHFITFFVDMVGADEVVLRLLRRDDQLGFEIEIPVRGAGEPGWQPEAMFDRRDQKYGNFASDSLGPMIARGLIELMRGDVALSRPAPGRAVLAISVPVDMHDAAPDCVRLELDSPSVELVLRALMGKLGRKVCGVECAEHSVSAVLVEAGGDAEPARLAKLRAALPGAILIAIGAPGAPDAFDAVCPQPVTAEALERALADVGWQDVKVV